MSEFLKLFDKIRREYPVYLEIKSNNTTGWNVRVKYPTEKSFELAFSILENDVELAFAEAHFMLVQWTKNHPEMKK